MPTTNLGNPQNISQTVPMVDPSPIFAAPCSVARSESQPTSQQQPSTYFTTALPTQMPVIQTQLPTVVMRPPTTPKFYRGDASYKAYREYFECLSVCNGWISPMQKAQNLIISLEGPAAETVHGLEIKQDQDYETIWELLKNGSHTLMTLNARNVSLTDAGS